MEGITLAQDWEQSLHEESWPEIKLPPLWPTAIQDPQDQHTGDFKLLLFSGVWFQDGISAAKYSLWRSFICQVTFSTQPHQGLSTEHLNWVNEFMDRNSYRKGSSVSGQCWWRIQAPSYILQIAEPPFGAQEQAMYLQCSYLCHRKSSILRFWKSA